MIIWEVTTFEQMTYTERVIVWLKRWAATTPCKCDPKTAETLMNLMGKGAANYGNL